MNLAGVDIDADTAIVGAPTRTTMQRHNLSNAGAAYVFKRSGTAGLGKASGTGTNDHVANDRFGSAVAVDGETVSGLLLEHQRIGSSSKNNAGAAYVFTRRIDQVCSRKLSGKACRDAITTTTSGTLDLHNDLIVGALLRFSEKINCRMPGRYVCKRISGTWNFVQSHPQPRATVTSMPDSVLRCKSYRNPHHRQSLPAA